LGQLAGVLEAAIMQMASAVVAQMNDQHLAWETKATEELLHVT
jgi:hypothetical protein